MKRTITSTAIAAALTIASGAAQASEPVVPEATIPVSAISVSPEGELQFTSEFQVAEEIFLTGAVCNACGSSSSGCFCKS